MRDALDQRWSAVVVLLAGSGRRIGELLGPIVDDVDFLRRTVRVERQRLQSTVTPVTSKASRRTVPVGQVVIDVLAAHLSAYPTERPLVEDEAGEPLSYRRWGRLLSDAGELAGVEVGSHGLRHCAASALISGAVQTCAHLFQGDEDRTRNVLDAALGPLADCRRTEAASNQ